MRRPSTALLLLASLGCVLAALVTTTSRADSPSVEIVTPKTADASVLACGEGLTAITDDACFAAPIGSKPAPLILYLHGLYQPQAMREELDRQARVAKHAEARGYAVLALHGRLGICDTRGDHLDWICWPSNEQVASRAAEVVASWKEPLAFARARVGAGRTYVLGFSNGAYFAGLLGSAICFGQMRTSSRKVGRSNRCVRLAIVRRFCFCRPTSKRLKCMRRWIALQQSSRQTIGASCKKSALAGMS